MPNTLLSAAWAALVLLVSCNPKAPDDVEARGGALRAEAQRLHCRMLELYGQTVALWDETTEQLRQDLPPDMPADERRNMLAVRNTALIQMFEVYPALDTAIHRLVEEAGRQDEALAAQMRAVKDSIDQNDEQFRSWLGQLQAERPNAFSHWKKRYDTIGCE